MNSGRYWLCVSGDLKITRRQKMKRPPALIRTLDNCVWVSVSKKAWAGYRVGDVVRVSDIGEEGMRLVASSKKPETETGK